MSVNVDLDLSDMPMDDVLLRTHLAGISGGSGSLADVDLVRCTSGRHLPLVGALHQWEALWICLCCWNILDIVIQDIHSWLKSVAGYCVLRLYEWECWNMVRLSISSASSLAHVCGQLVRSQWQPALNCRWDSSGVIGHRIGLVRNVRVRTTGVAQVRDECRTLQMLRGDAIASGCFAVTSRQAYIC
jgi:hypothetical protein